MAQVAIGERVERVRSTCASATRDRGELTAALSDLARIESWAAARRAELVAALAEQPGAFPEADIADTTGCSLGAATKETERADTLGRVEAFADALDSGDIRPGHVDALTKATNDLDDALAATLLDEQHDLADLAASSSIRDFERHLARRKRELESETDRERRLERQRKNTRLRSWVDKADGMWCFSGRFDPQTGDRLRRAIDDASGAVSAAGTPATAPLDPIERRHHVDALALVGLIEGNSPAGSRPGDPIVVVDATAAVATTDAAISSRGGPALDWGIPVELPMSVLRDVFDASDPDVIIVADGVILHAPGRLHLGRSTRLANRAQRRALRGLYSTCAVPGCSVHYDRCRLHHVIWWRHGGLTDIDNLLPICQHHHTRLHDDGWQVALGPNRELTITMPDGRMMSTGPPRRSAA